MLDVSMYDYTIEQIRLLLNNFGFLSFFMTIGLFTTLYTGVYMAILGIKYLILKIKEVKNGRSNI